MINNKILIVDDSYNWIEFHISTIKEFYGDIFEITTANSAFEGLKKVQDNKESPFSVIISDLQMEKTFEPTLAGEWFINNVKLIREYNNTKIILISGMPNVEHISSMLNVACIKKGMLYRNRLFLKYMFEQLMPCLSKIQDDNSQV